MSWQKLFTIWIYIMIYSKNLLQLKTLLKLYYRYCAIFALALITTVYLLSTASCKTPIYLKLSYCTEKVIYYGLQGPSMPSITIQWADLNHTSHSMYGLWLLLSIGGVCTLTVPHWWAISQYNFHLPYHDINKLYHNKEYIHYIAQHYCVLK